MSGWSLRLAKAEDADHLQVIERTAGQLFSDDPDLGTFDFDEVGLLPSTKN